MTVYTRFFPSLVAIASLWALSLGSTALAQSTPGAGQLLQQMPQQPLDVPSQDLDLNMLQAPEVQAPESTPFAVQHIEITGNTLLPDEQLRALVAGSEGKRLTLADLYALAAQISAAYHDAGYPLARAYVPAQTIEDGRVRIAVAEARYGEVSLSNKSRVRDRKLKETLAPVHAGEPVYNPTLERSLLLLSDIPGVGVSSVIRPGAAVGTSDLDVSVVETPLYSGTIALDDYGNNATGVGRLSGTLNINSPFRYGDRISLGGVTSGGGLNYFSAQYRSLLNGQGTTLDVGGSWMRYKLGHGFGHPSSLKALDATGGAGTGYVALTHPFIRATRGNLYGQVKYEYRRLKDDLGSVGIHDRRNVSALSLTLAGDRRDSRGVTNFRVSGTFGKLHYRDPVYKIIDQATVDTAGSYGVGRASVSRLQRLADHHAIYAGYTFQFGASRNLDPSEQFYLGGPTTVRGLRPGVLSGSTGGVATLEYRYDWRTEKLPGLWQASAFLDTGHVKPYKNNPVPGSRNSAHVSSVGLGLNWYGANDWVLSAAVARRIGSKPELLAGQNTRTRVWVQLRKGFN